MAIAKIDPRPSHAEWDERLEKRRKKAAKEKAKRLAAAKAEKAVEAK
ncbi:MAG: hypothetical protein WCR67_02200 [Bacilli bacterium]